MKSSSDRTVAVLHLLVALALLQPRRPLPKSAGVRVAVQTSVWAAAGDGWARRPSRARAAHARAGNRGGRRGALGETSVGAGIVKRRRGSVAVPISVVFVSIVRESPVHGLAGRDHACGLPVAEDFQERTQAIRQQLRFDAANR